MKLVHPNIDFGFDFQKKNYYSLVIENADEFFRLTKQILNQTEGEEGQWVLSEVLPININKNILVLSDFYNLSCNNKKMESLLKSKILGLNGFVDMGEVLSRINADILDLNDIITSNFDFKIEYNDEITLESILKLLKYSFSDEEILLKKVVNYIEIYSELNPIKLVVFVGMTALLNETDIENLIKEISYRDIKMFFIDSFDKQIFKKENKIIVDKDLCLI